MSTMQTNSFLYSLRELVSNITGVIGNYGMYVD